MTIEEMITDEQLDNAWGNANFGAGTTKRDLIRYTLLKFACGYHSGHTAQCVVRELGLVLKKKDQLSMTGKEYLYEAFRNGTNL